MFERKTTPESFWKWFVTHEDMLYDFEQDQEATFDKLIAKLEEINRHLTFEFGPKIDRRREFVISADGIKDAFPSVIALATAAPKLERWQITAFRPRRPPTNPIEMGRTSVEPSQVQFSLRDNGKMIGIDLFIPGYDEKVITWGKIGYLFLDEALGEYDVETKVGPIRMFPCSQRIEHERFPFAQLPEIFDKHILTLQHRSNSDFIPPRPN